MISRGVISMKGQNDDDDDDDDADDEDDDDDDDDYCFMEFYTTFCNSNFPVSYSFLDIDCYSFISQELILLYIHYKLLCLILYFYFISDVYFTI
jgi:hypothetical protein